MSEIIIDKSYSTQKDIERCIEAFYGEPSENGHLEIKFTEQIVEIDILLIAYLILFKELKPDLEITVEIKSNPDKDLEPKLYQYLIYAFLMTGKSVLKIKTDKREYSIDGKKKDTFQRYFVISESFMPILLVGTLPDSGREDLYDLLFKETLKDLDKLPNGVDPDKNNEQQYRNLNRWIKGYGEKRKIGGRDTVIWNPVGVIKSSDRPACIRYLARLAFYNTLRRAKITRFYLCDNEEEMQSLRIGQIQKKGGKYPQIEFFKEIKWIFDDLSTRPPIYHFVYSQLLSSELLPNKFNNGNKETIKEILHSLWEYAKDMVVGIKELAKNIREHANPPIGVITGRIYKEEKWTELKRYVQGADTVFDNYLKTLKNNEKEETEFSFFDFNVIDLGKKGVIETIKEKTEKIIKNENIDEKEIDLFKEDLQTLNNGEIKLRHFLDPSLGNTLNQQTKKAIAHLGLLIFSYLIKENNGFLRAGSHNCEPFLTYKDNSSKYAKPIPFGTNYHIVLPIWKEKKVKPLLPHPLNIPLESALMEIKGIEELLNYDLINLACDRESTKDNISDSEKCLLRIYFNENKKDYWECINTIMKTHQENLQKSFVCIDFEKVEIDESQLFRFLGTWNLHYPNISLIVSNIKTDIFKNLIKINEQFIEKIKRIYNNNSVDDNSIYWNENTVILIYSYCELESGERFYFTDILWGKDKQDFYRVNKLIRKTNFNATTILLRKDNVNNDQNYDDNRLALIAQSGFFYSRTTLLQFDLLLPGNNKLSLFEHNASVLLQNELKLQENNNLNNE